MTITLDTLKAEHERLGAMIAAFEAQPVFPIQVEFPTLKEGEKFVGVIISADGAKREAVILLPDEFKGNWKEATEWAESIGGELPDRCESALLFATMKDEFKSEWYWTREQYGSCSAWVQYFYYGVQGYYGRNVSGRARAVRRLKIS
jgi:hypothetical protein